MQCFKLRTLSQNLQLVVTDSLSVLDAYVFSIGLDLFELIWRSYVNATGTTKTWPSANGATIATITLTGIFRTNDFSRALSTITLSLTRLLVALFGVLSNGRCDNHPNRHGDQHTCKNALHGDHSYASRIWGTKGRARRNHDKGHCTITTTRAPFTSRFENASSESWCSA